MPFTEDLSVLYDVAGFASTAVWTPAAGGGPYTIQVIFDNDYYETHMGDAGASGRLPVVRAMDSQIAQGAGMKRNDALVINSVTYKVREVKPMPEPGESFVFLGV